MYRWVKRWAETTPDRPALVDADSGDTWTYAALDRTVRAVAADLESQGVGPDSVVGTLMDRGPEYVITIWAVLRTGATLVPLDTDEPANTTRERCSLADVDHLVHDEVHQSLATAVFPDPGRLSRVDQLQSGPTDSASGTRSEEAGQPLEGTTQLHLHGPDETRLLVFTSGTTGDPQAVRLTRRNIGASAAGSAFRLDVEADDRWFLTLPLYHMGGLSIPLRSAMYGTAVVVERAFDAARSADRMRSHQVTGVSLVPTMLERLLDAGWRPENLRFALVGGAPTSQELAERALESDIPLHTTYGMTETASQIATAVPTELRTNPDTVGRPLRTVDVDILDEDGTTLPPESEGEIVASGPVVSPGYLQSDRPTGDAFETGDVGYLDDSGRLFVTGRKSAVIITGGENVHPTTVEAALQALEVVADAAVVGVPDDEWGERVAALVVPVGDPATRSIRTALRDRLPNYAIPKTIQFAEAIPRTQSGTVDRVAVRDAVRKPEDTRE